MKLKWQLSLIFLTIITIKFKFNIPNIWKIYIIREVYNFDLTFVISIGFFQEMCGII